MAGTTGRGLRGGSFVVTHTPSGLRIDYHGVRFSRDISITGQATLDDTNSSLVSTVTVRGSNGPIGTLTMRAVLWNPAHPNATLTGTLHRKTVDLLAAAR